MPLLQEALNDPAPSVSETAQEIIDALAGGEQAGFSRWGSVYYE